MQVQETEFFGNLEMVGVKDNRTLRVECVDWLVVDPSKTNHGNFEIEDGDQLQVFNTNGQLLLNKLIMRDHQLMYNSRYQKQLVGGIAVKWLPKGIDVGFWMRLFSNHYRARLVKRKNVEE